MQKHLVIIGGVAAGTKAAAKARREDPELKISIYTTGNFVSYSACGLPFFIGNTFENYKRLLVRTPEEFKEKENIDIYLQHQVLKIEPEQHKIRVKKLETGEEFDIEYTKLLIATGARPFVPDIEGANCNNVFTLRNVEDGIAIKNYIPLAKKAVIIGAGLIGLEVAEAFKEQGLDVTILELAPQILTPFDEEIAAQIQAHVEEKSVTVITGDCTSRFICDENNNVKQIETTSGKLLDVDLVLLSIGVKPNVELAAEAGIEIGTTGAIKVNKRMETNLPDIYAAGDCAEKRNMITNEPVWIPLGSTANKEGRVAAVNITGGHEDFRGVLNSSVTKIFDFTAAKTGLTEKNAKMLGYDYEVAIVPKRDRAGYIPGAENITIKLIADKFSRRILGAQIIGKGDCDKRVNVIATAITANMTVDELEEVDITYSPPYSPAIDPILLAAQVLQNKLDKKAEGIKPEDAKAKIKGSESCILIDVRDPEEFKKGHYLEARNIPFDSLDEKEIEKYKEKEIFICCQQGMQAYMTVIKLRRKGFKSVKFIEGGFATCPERKQP